MPTPTNDRAAATPFVSIVTPAYNQAAYLPETIESVLRQTYPHLEYIVIDDGSTDDTPAIIARYANQLRALWQPNAGQAETLNRGWNLAGGEIIGYLSSDDVLRPTAVSTLVSALLASRSAVAAFPNCDVIDPRSHVTRRSVCRPFDLEQLVVGHRCFIGPGALFWRGAYEKAGKWQASVKLAPDREFWMRLAEHGEIVFVPEVLADYRANPRSISYRGATPEAAEEFIAVLDAFFMHNSRAKELIGRHGEAYGIAHLMIARACFNAGQVRRGLAAYAQACRLHPPLSNMSAKAVLARSVAARYLRHVLYSAQAWSRQLRAAHRGH